MTPARKPHPQRCETCKKLWKTDCPYYAWVKTGEVGISCDSYMEFTAIVGCAGHSATHTSPPAPNPCEENGCTDIENCDEICQHSRIYSPVQMEAAKATVAKAARDQFIDEVITECEWDGPITQEDVWRKLESLRAQQVHPSTKGGEPR